MAFGDSLTRGIGDLNTFGWRDHLQAILGYTVMMVGPYADPVADSTYGVAHAGEGGATTAYLLTKLPSFLATYLPTPNPTGSMVLLMVGTPDIIASVDTTYDPAVPVANVSAMLDAIVAHDPTLKIVVSLIPPVDHALNSRVLEYNTALQTMLQARQASLTTLLIVDDYTAISTHPNWQTEYMADKVHPNDAGYTVLAQTRKAGIQP